MGLRKVFRSLQGVNDEVKRYNGVLKKFADAGDDEWEAIVAVHRGDLQKAFFEHLQVLTGATVRKPEHPQQMSYRSMIESHTV